MRNPTTIPLLFLLALLATACGGGGGGEGGGGDLNLDDGPRIASFTPEPGAADVEPDTLIEIVFQDPLDPASVLPTQMALSYDGTPIEGNAVYSPARQAIAFAASDVLPTAATIEVTLHPGIRDLEDRVRAEPLIYRFRVRASEIPAPTRLEFGTDIALWTSGVVLDGSGHGMLVYGQTDFEDVDALFARPWTRRDGLGSPRALDFDEAPGAHQHDAHRIDRTGFITGWRTNTHTTGNDALLQSYDLRTQTWSGEISLDTSVTVESKYPAVGRSETGHMIAVWEQERLSNGNISIFSRVYVPGDGWGLRLGLDGGNEPADQVHVAMNASGHAVVLFRRHFGDDVRMYARQWNPADGWGALEPMGAAPTDDGLPRRAFMGRDGTAVVVWYEREGGVERLYARRFNPHAAGGPAWEPAHEIVAPGEPALHVRRVYGFVDGSGGATLAMQYTIGSNNYRLAAVRLDPITGWGPALPLGNPEDEVERSLEADEHEGAMALTWYADMDRSEDGIQRFVAVTGPDGLFRAPVPVARHNGNRTRDHRADVAITPGGGAIVVWIDVSSGTTRRVSTAHARVIHADGSAEPIVDLDRAAAVLHNVPRLDVDARGRGLLVYTRGAETGQRDELWIAEIR